MKNLNYPKGSYQIPKKNILVISCMDLRLTDNLVDFLHFDNLENRYDHFILAGTSLCCTEHRNMFKDKVHDKYKDWKFALDQHIELAVSLHDIKDVYIIEHEDCGAYKNFLNSEVNMSTPKLEKEIHKKFASELAKKIRNTPYPKDKKEDPPTFLAVHCFYIDLRGNVELLKTFTSLKHN